MPYRSWEEKRTTAPSPTIHRLAERSWDLIRAIKHPFLWRWIRALQNGGPRRQGEGIIDLVNTYA